VGSSNSTEGRISKRLHECNRSQIADGPTLLVHVLACPTVPPGCKAANGFERTRKTCLSSGFSVRDSPAFLTAPLRLSGPAEWKSQDQASLQETLSVAHKEFRGDSSLLSPADVSNYSIPRSCHQFTQMPPVLNAGGWHLCEFTPSRF
jgi:hypothetical protein